MTSMAAVSTAFRGIENIYAPQKTNSDYSKDSNIFNDIRSFDADEFVPQTKKNVEPPKIGIFRVLFHRLTKEQIKAVNESKQLPKNAKFKGDTPYMTWNLIDFTKGTHKLPAGYELKRDLLGFTHVEREGSKAWYLRKS